MKGVVANATEGLIQERPKPGWIETAQAEATPEELRLWQALEEVLDPEYPVSVVDMGLIYGLKHEDRLASVQLTFTSMGCPAMEFIIDDINFDVTIPRFRFSKAALRR